MCRKPTKLNRTGLSQVVFQILQFGSEIGQLKKVGSVVGFSVYKTNKNQNEQTGILVVFLLIRCR